MADIDAYKAGYRELLKLFLAGQEEKALFEVAELSKNLVAFRLGPDVLLDMHASCIREAVQDLDPMMISRMVVNANDILLSGIMAYAMSYYSFLDILDAAKKRTEEAELRLVEEKHKLDHLVVELEKKTLDLGCVNERLQDLDRLKSLFIASMSHELRTPLNSIIGFTGLILQGMTGEINEEQRDQLQRVAKAGKHLLALITDVIDVSRIETGKIEAQVEEFPLDSVLSDALANFKLLIKEKRLKIEISMMPEQIVVKTDRKRLLQCVLNYLGNAVKFTEKGKITIRAEVKGERMELQVIDTGIGIKAEDLPRLFQSFVRLDTPLQTTVPGTGLGLYLTKKLVTEVLGGEVSATSQYGQGSTFVLSIPKDLGEKPGT